jgi:hypothetical protein
MVKFSYEYSDCKQCVTVDESFAAQRLGRFACGRAVEVSNGKQRSISEKVTNRRKGRQVSI